MKQDYYRIVGVLLVALLLGLLIGHVYACLFLGLLVYIYWQYKTTNQLLLWMQHKRDVDAPNMPGLFDAIAKQFEYVQLHNEQRKKKLASFLRRFREATQALPDGIVVLGENDEIEWANDKAEEYLGIRNSQDRGQRIVNLIRHPSLIRFMKEAQGTDRGFEKSLELISPISKDIHLELRLVDYGDSEKLLVARDITKIYRINRMRTDFIANASHELRTPLTVISGYLESFEDDLSGQEPDEIRTRIRQMRNQTERMRRLIEDLLKLSSLETTEQLTHKETVRVPDLLANIVEEAKTISGVVKHEFDIEIDQKLWIEGDRNQIYSAISNVVFNAVQHTPDKGRITLRWFLGREGDAVFEVIDTGEGISADHIPRITERFYRVDRGRSREKGGTGLGLAIVKHILAKHNTRLEVESRLSAGSVFRFRFPRALVIRKDIIADRPAREQAVKV